MAINLATMSPKTGRMIKEDNTIINQADLLVGNAVVFLDEVTIATNSEDFEVGGYKILTIEVTGDSSNSARTVKFYAKGLSGTLVALAGVNLSTYAIASETTGKAEIWQFDISGLDYIAIHLTAITGGKVSVTGRVIA